MTPDQFAVLRRLLIARLVKALVELFLGLGDWRDTDARRFVDRAVPLVLAAQRTLAAATSVYIAQTASEALHEATEPLTAADLNLSPQELFADAVWHAAATHSIAPAPIPDSEATNLRGIDNVTVYHRPFVQLYTDLARGQEFPDALAHAQTRLTHIAELDMQQTESRAARHAMRTMQPAAARPTGWRRVLVGPVNCALCVIASTQRYHIEQLKQIHPNCDCGVLPLYGRQAHVIDEQTLRSAHEAVAELTGKPSDPGGRSPDFSKILIDMTHEHGEAGPMLARPMDRFTSWEDIPRRTWR